MADQVWEQTVRDARNDPQSFGKVHTNAKMLMGGGYNHLDTAKAVAEVTRQSYDHGSDTNVFYFKSGVIILSMDGVTAYFGERAQ